MLKYPFSIFVLLMMSIAFPPLLLVALPVTFLGLRKVAVSRANLRAAARGRVAARLDADYARQCREAASWLR